MGEPPSRTLLILGGGGAIGSSVVAEALRSGQHVHATVRPGNRRARLPLLAGSVIHPLDLTQAGALQAVIEQVDPEVVVMAAFPPSHPGTNHVQRAAYLQSVIAMQFALFQALERSACRASLVLIGSSTVYGVGTVRDPAAPMHPQNFRGVAKAAELLLAERLAAEQDRSLVELRVFCAYGRWMRKDRLLTRALRAALTGERIHMAEGSLPRDWIHHDDIGRAVLCASALEAKIPHARVINLCSGTLVDCHDVIQRIETLCGRALVSPEPWPGGDRMGEVLAGIPPTEQDLPGWSRSVDLKAGLDDLWAWTNSVEGRHYLLEDEDGG